MDKYAYRFTVASLNISIILLVGSGVVLVFQKQNAAQLLPYLAPILTLLGGLLVSPPKSQLNDHRQS